METGMTLVESVRPWVIANLPHDRSDAAIDAALNAKSPMELLVLYLNWRERLIPAVPRQVSRSPEFESNPVASKRSTTIAQIIDDIKQGRDLTRYLSRRVKVGFDLPWARATKNLNRSHHLDLLLNDWGIHHLHISTTAEADGFVERDGPVILAIFRPKCAYLIDVGNHGDWAQERLIRVVVATWPDDELALEIKWILGGGRSYTNDERAKRRAAGISTFVQIDNRVFAPAVGISTAGTSVKVLVRAGRIMRAVGNFQKQMQSDLASIVELIRQHGCYPADTPEFEFGLSQQGFAIIERTSGVAIGLGV